ncbi:MAG: response regulator [Deltaproteobacteria bacterium]|nr:response regulator [Deltaproteobacteria bacterium]
MKKILVIDDEYATRFLFEEELAGEGYEVITAGSSEGIFHIIEDQRPDLIILDILLDGANGLDVLQDIRNTYYDMPVILCTGYPDFRYDIKSLAADYFVDKNSDLSELKNKIEMALESKIAFMIIPEIEDNIQIMLPVIRKRMEPEVWKSAG